MRAFDTAVGQLCDYRQGGCKREIAPLRRRAAPTRGGANQRRLSAQKLARTAAPLPSPTRGRGVGGEGGRLKLRRVAI